MVPTEVGEENKVTSSSVASLWFASMPAQQVSAEAPVSLAGYLSQPVACAQQRELGTGQLPSEVQQEGSTAGKVHAKQS